LKNLIIPISIGLLCTAFAISPTARRTNAAVLPHAASGYLLDSSNALSPATNIYQSMNLQMLGMSKKAFDDAWEGYTYLIANQKIKKNQYLTICDFSQSSSKKRLYIIDVSNKKLIFNTYVAHGRNSGKEYATSFSNTPESLQSSLGFYTTAATYIGAHGLSLRLEGLEPGINNNAFERSIVIHGAAYVDAARVKAGVLMGRSYGCPAVPQNEATNIINTIKNGTCLFIYHASNEYLNKSKILND
jgi:hypothetical protein